MAFTPYTSHACMPALPGRWSFVGTARVDAAAALITNQPRGY
jgi:hypothetical protein